MLPDSLIELIRNRISQRKDLKENLEVEVRFKNFSARKNGPLGYQDFPQLYFDRLMKGFTSKGYKYVDTHVIDQSFRAEIFPGVKGIYRMTDYIKGPSAIAQTVITKRPLLTLGVFSAKEHPIFEQFPFMIAISSERTAQMFKRPEGVELMKREKLRRSFDIARGKFTLDLTEVRYPDGKVSFEAELEFNSHNINDLTLMDPLVEEIFRIMWSSDYLYTFDQQVEAAKVITSVFNLKPEPGKIPLKIMPQPRNILRNDIREGGLIGFKDIGYYVTQKVDGLRAVLLIHQKNVWLIRPPTGFSLIAQLETEAKDVYILDGEHLPQGQAYRLGSEAPTEKYWYIPFDCIVYEGQAVHQENYARRLELIDEFVGIMGPQLKSYNIRVTRKTFKALNQVADLFTEPRALLDKRPVLPYPTDGLLFIPNSSFTSVTEPSVEKGPRSLTKQPDICKWKEINTIDLQINLKKKELYAWQNEFDRDGKRGYPVQFVGSNRYPFDSSKVNWKLILDRRYPDETIAEFSLIGGQLTPIRIRSDKTKPNGITVILNVWDDMNDPISIDLFYGRDDVLMRSYHNRIKRNLYQQDSPKGKVLLDIGSGRGGDLSKWRDYVLVFAVEPNEDNRKELTRRLEQFGDMKNRVVVIAAGGENTSEIAKGLATKNIGTVNTISLMLSLSFFWTFGEERLQSLANNIRQFLAPNGSVLFMTIDGHLVDQAYRPAFNVQTDPFVNFEHKFVEIEYRPPELIFDYKDRTIVGRQREGLVYIDQLHRLLDPDDFELKFQERADKEIVMTEFELRVSSLYSYGIFRRMSDGLGRIKLLRDIVKPKYVVLRRGRPRQIRTGYTERETGLIPSEVTDEMLTLEQVIPYNPSSKAGKIIIPPSTEASIVLKPESKIKVTFPRLN